MFWYLVSNRHALFGLLSVTTTTTTDQLDEHRKYVLDLFDGRIPVIPLLELFPKNMQKDAGNNNLVVLHDAW